MGKLYHRTLSAMHLHLAAAAGAQCAKRCALGSQRPASGGCPPCCALCVPDRRHQPCSPGLLTEHIELGPEPGAPPLTRKLIARKSFLRRRCSQLLLVRTHLRRRDEASFAFGRNLTSMRSENTRTGRSDATRLYTTLHLPPRLQQPGRYRPPSSTRTHLGTPEHPTKLLAVLAHESSLFVCSSTAGGSSKFAATIDQGSLKFGLCADSTWHSCFQVWHVESSRFKKTSGNTSSWKQLHPAATTTAFHGAVEPSADRRSASRPCSSVTAAATTLSIASCAQSLAKCSAGFFFFFFCPCASGTTAMMGLSSSGT